MNIDWFTFAAQIINFLLLVVLLRWLLYDPIVRAIAQREEEVSARLREGRRAREEADSLIREHQEQLRQLEQQREGFLESARQDAREEYQRLLKESTEEVRRRRTHWLDGMRREQEEFLVELRRKAGSLGLHAARRTLEQLAGADLEQRMYDVFAARLEQIDEKQQSEIQRHLADGRTEVLLRCAFDISRDQRQRFEDLIRDTFHSVTGVAFERSADLICGLELLVGGYRFGWSVQDFLQDLAADLFQRLGEPS